MWPADDHQRAAYIRWLTANTAAFIAHIREQRELTVPDPKKPRNLLRLAGVINAANSEADNEAGELIQRVRTNQARMLALIAKGHQNEALREQMLIEAEKEQALADLQAAVGDNGGPLLEEDGDEAAEKLRATLKAAKSPDGSKGSQEVEEKAKEPGAAEEPKVPPPNPEPPQAEQTAITMPAVPAGRFDQIASPPAVGLARNFHE